MDDTEVGLHLQELQDLYSSGALSDDEFALARSRLLQQAGPGAPWYATAPTAPHPVDARPPTAPLPVGTGPAPGHRTRSVVIAVSAAVVLVALVVGGFFWVRSRVSSGAPQEAAATTAPAKLGEGRSASAPAGLPEAVQPATALAQCVSQPSKDAGGNPTSYEPAQAVDARPDTAWRCDGDGVGQTLEIRFRAPHDVDTIGMIPGLAKTDPYDGTDRYAQDRRIAAVQYAFDDGTTAVQRFDTDPGNRSLQSMQVPRVRTEHVYITILASVPGSQVGGQPAVDKVAVSEVAFSGPA
jgi:hypothetical protein